MKSLFYLLLGFLMLAMGGNLFADDQNVNISGKVTNFSTGAAIAGATIQVQLGGTTILTRTSNASGDYFFNNLNNGTYTVICSQPGFQTVTTSNVVVINPQITTCNFQLVGLGSISGTITNNTSGAVIAGATVQMLQNNSVVSSTTTAANGTYSITGLAPGSFTLSVSASLFQTNTAAVTITSSNTVQNLALQPSPGNISGTVSNSITSQGLSGATLTFSKSGQQVASTTSGSLGAYTVTGLPPATYSISVNLAGYKTGTGTAVVTSNNTTTFNISLVPLNGSLSGTVRDAVTNNTLAGATITVLQGSTIIKTGTSGLSGTFTITELAPGNYTVTTALTNYQTLSSSVTIISSQTTTLNPLLQPLPGNVSGAVTNSQTSAGLAGATVSISNGTTVIASTTTNGSGNYSITGLTPGSYTLTATLSNFVAVAQSITIPSNATLTKNVALTPQVGIISGTVQDSSTLSPIVGATVTLLQGSTVVSTTATASLGTYSFSVLPGSYTLQVSNTNYTTKNATANVASNATTTVNVLLVASPGNVSGVIKDAVTLTALNGATVQVLQGSTVVGSGVTNSSGNYSITGIPPGSYTLSASLVNYTTGTTPITIASNQTTTANINLQPQNGTASGLVIDAISLAPIQGATVGFYQGSTLIASTITSSSGNYSLSTLVPGSYTLKISATNYQTATQAITIQSNSTTTTNLSLQPLSGTVSGAITNAQTTSPLSGVTITLSQGSTVIATTVTNASGNYTFTGVVPGSYTVAASLANFTTSSQSIAVNPNASTTQNFSLQPQSGTLSGQVFSSLTAAPLSNVSLQALQGLTVVATTTTNGSGNYTFTLAPGSYTVQASFTNYQTLSQSASVQSNSTTTLNFSLTPVPGIISGTVTSASTSSPLSNVTVNVQQGQTTVATVQTSATGTYTVGNLTPGSYSVVFSLNNYQTVTQPQTVTSNATTTANASLQLQPGNVTGVITNALNSTPISSATVTAMQGVTMVAITTTGSNGSYQLSSLSPGTYTISVVATDFQTASQGSVVVAPNATTTVNMSLQPVPGTVSGFITDSVTTNPIQNATVSVTQNGGTLASTLSGVNGAYSIGSLVPGSYTLVVSAASYQSTSQALTITSNATTTASVALQASPGAISGTVTSSLTSNPISGATVQVLNGNTVLGSATTAVNGTYTISGLAPAASGVYTFKASAANFQTVTSTAAVVANTTTPVSFSLAPQPGTITGTLTNAQNGSVISGGSIQILQGATVFGLATTDTNGLYTVTGLAPGVYTVSASASNFQSNSQSATVSANATTTSNLALQPSPGSLSGVITDSVTSNPISGATVAVWNQSVQVASTLTLGDGSYSITGLTPGSYTIILSAPTYQSSSVSVTIFSNQNSTLNQALQALPGTITGTVLSGTPLSGANVTIAQGSTILATLTTDGSGNYTSNGLSPGNYIVTASSPTYQTATSGALVVANMATTVNFNLVSQPGTFSGTIIDATTQSPLSNAIVTVLSGNVTIASTVTAFDGSYTISGLAPGNYLVSASALNYQTATQGASAQALVTTTVNVSLQPQPGSLSGQVTDSVTLSGISGASVVITQNNLLITSALTDSNGFYSATGLATGSYSVTFQAANYQNSVKGAVIVSNANSTLNVALQSSPGTITGQVLDSSSNPLSGSFISLFANNVLLTTQVSDAQGNFTFNNLAPGTYSLVAQLANYQTLAQAAIVTANATTTVSLTLQADPGSCTCTIVDALTSLPMSGVNVSLLQGSVTIATAATDSSGEAHFVGLAPGSYQITATALSYQSVAQGVIIQSNQTTSVALSLQPDPGAISGNVTDAVTGNSISGATVNVITGGVTIATALTDNNGAYLVNSLSPGQYSVRISANNYQASLQVASILPNLTTSLNAALQQSPGNIAIVITDSITTNSITGAAVSIYNPLSNIPLATGITDGTGNCLISGLAPGTYNVVITAANYQSLSLSGSVSANATTNLSLQLLPDPGSISCIITDSVSSLPLSGCLVEALKGSTVIASGLTDASGTCQLSSLAPGSYIVRASLANYQTATQAAIVMANAQTSLQMSLVSQPGSLTGTVTDALTLGTLPQAQLSLFSGQTLIATTFSDASGSYLFTGLAPGSYTLSVGLLNYQTLTGAATILANQTTSSNWALQSQPGSLLGTVLDATTTLPIVGAEIVVLNGPTIVADILTDSSGNYSVAGLSPNVSYTIRASATNYQTAIQGVTVQSNQTKTVNFSLNAQPGSIVGQVTDDVTSAALVGATVDLLQNAVLIASTQTDSFGNYQIQALAPGSYTLKVGASLYQTMLVAASVQASQTTTVNVALQANPGSAQGTVIDAQTTSLLPNSQIQVFAGSNLVASSLTDTNGNYFITGIAPGQYSITATSSNYQTLVKTVTIQSNSTATVNFALQPNPGSVIGKVISATTGNPIVGANISIFQGSNILASATSDSNGNYVLNNLAPGQYTVVASSNLFQNAAQGATVIASQATTVNFSLADQPGSITGTVIGAAATLDLFEGQSLVASTATASDGSFSFLNLAPGNYTLRAQAQNFQTAILGVTVLANMTTTVSVTLQAQTGTISGQVVDATTSNPLSDVTIEAIQNSVVVDSVLTDSSGNFTMLNLAPGTYTVRATLATYQIAVQGATVQANTVSQANFSLNSLPGSIAGQVTDAGSGALLAETEIDVLQGSLILASVLTDSNGNYLVSNLAPGSYTVRATLINYETNLQSAVVLASNTTPVNFVLTQAPGSVQGQITDANTSQPITTASVVVNILQSNIIVGSALTDSNGNYVISGLSQGNYTLQIAAGNYQTITQGISILANTVTTANIALQPQPGAISGTITDQTTSLPISGAVVNIMQGSTIFASVLTDTNGVYIDNQLAPGTYIVRVSATNYQTNSQAAIVQASSTTTVNIALQSQPGTLSGNVSDTTPTPLAGAVVTVKSGNTVISTVLTDTLGNYVITGLAPGSYSVFASSSNYQTAFSVVTIVANTTSQLLFNLFPQPGSISGQVIDSGTLQPITSVEVDLLQNGVAVASVLTDAQGNYTLNSLAPGQYTLRASANNYATSTLGVGVVSNATATVNFSLNSLPATISGVITDSLTALPIANATIQIYQGSNLVGSSVSDANGAYSISGLSPGNDNVLVTAGNYQNYTQGVSLQANQTTTVNASLLANPATVIGTVVDSVTQTPLANATVQVLSGSTLIGPTFTDANGVFTLSGLNPGTYTLNVFATDYQSSTTAFFVVANQTLSVNIALAANPGTLSGTVYDSVSMTPIIGANVALLQGSTSVISLLSDNNGAWTVPNLALGSYTVVTTATGYQSSVTGALVQATATTAVTTLLVAQPGSVVGQVTSSAVPLAGATIEVLQGVTVVGTALTDGSGNYFITSLAPGAYTIRASASNFNTVVQGLIITANQQETANFSLSPNPGSIAGNVTDSTSQPLVGITILVSRAGALVASTVTDANGNYQIDSLSPGNYTITTSSPLYQTTSQGAAVSSNQTTTVNLTLQDQPGSIAGQIVDQLTGLSLSGASITVLNGSIVLGTTLSDSNGNYVISGLAPGFYTVRATLNTYQTVVQSALVVATATTTVNFILTPNPGSVSGQITDMNSDPITGGSVMLHVLQGDIIIASGLTDSSGIYLIDNLPAGNYTLSIMAAGFQSAINSLVVTQGQTTTLNVALAMNPGNLTGTVSDTNGPVVGAAVQLYVNTNLLATVLTNSSGGYGIANLAPGQYVLQVAASNHQSVTEGVTIVANQSLQVDVSLSLNPGALSGSLTDAVSGLPLAGFIVNVSNNGILIATAITDANGNYLVSGLAPETYSVSALGPNYQTGTLSVTVLAGNTASANFSLQSQPGSIMGMVVDTNSSPIANVLIEALQDNNVISIAMTDSSGGYSLAGLAPGSYVVRASANLYQVALQGATVAASSQTITNFTLQSQPGSVSGVIQDAMTQTPIAGASVFVLQGGLQIASVLTQFDGTYSIAGLPVGSYVVQASSNGYQMNQQGIVVTANSALTVNLNLSANPGTVQGQIVDQASQPVAGATATLFNGSLFVATVQTDINGNYVLSNLAPGTYTLSISAPNYQTATQGVTVISLSQTIANFSLASQPGSVSGAVIDQNSQPIVGATVNISKNQVLMGSVLTDSSGNYALGGLAPGNYMVAVSAAGFQLNSQGAIVTANANTNVSFVLNNDTGNINVNVMSGLNSLAGATVQVMQNQVILSTTLTDAGGNATFSQLAPGVYSVVASAAGYQISLQTASVTSSSTTSMSFNLAANPGTLNGTVQDQSTSLPLANATVQVLQGSVIVKTALTEVDGSFSITGLAPGSYTLSVNLQDYQIYTAAVVIASGQTTVTSIGLMSNPGSVSGSITDSISGLGVPGALVEVLQNTTSIASQQTDSNGMYTINNLPPGSYLLRVSNATFQTTLVAFMVQANLTTNVNVALMSQPGSIIGVVTDSNTQNPIGNATVNVLINGLLIATTATDANGQYAVNNLAPVSYQVNVEASGYQTAVQGATVVASNSTELDFSLSTLVGGVTGVIQDVSSLPIAGAFISIFQGTTLITTTLTDANGVYIVSNLAPGSYTLVTTATNYQSNTQAINVQANATITADSILTGNPASLVGQVTDAMTSAPIAGATVQVASGQTVIATTLTDSTGQFAINNLSAQGYIVTVSNPSDQTAVQNITLSNGQVYVMNVALQPYPGSLSGTVLNDLSQPITNATIFLLQGFTTIGSTLSDNLGNYSLPGLSLGNYTVQVTAPGFQSATTGINVVAGTALTADFTLQPNPGTVQGTVTNGVIPLANVLVQVLNGNVLVGSTLTDSNGVYSLPNLAVGSRTIQASLLGFQTSTQGVQIVAGSTTTSNFVLQANPSTLFGTVISGVSLLPLPGVLINSYLNNLLEASILTDTNGQYTLNGLTSGNYTVSASDPNFQTSTLSLFLPSNTTQELDFTLASNPGSVIGVIYDVNGTPISGATITISQNNTVIASSISAADGSYTLSGLVSGTYTVTASAANDQAATQGVAVLSNQPVALDFTLQPLPSSFSGFVLDTQSNPIPGAQISIYQNGNLVSTIASGNNGAFSINGLGSGNYSVVISAPGFQTLTAGIVLTAGEQVNRTFVLSTVAGSIQGTVTDTSSNPLPNATIAISQSSIVVTTVRTDSNGAYTVNDLSPGSYVVTCSLPNYQTGLLGAIVVPNTVTNVNFQLATDVGQINGYITDLNLGTPVAAAIVTVFSQNAVVASGVSDTNGFYLIGGLPPESYIVTVQAPNYQASSQAAVVQTGMTTLASFGLLSNPGSIQGVVQSGSSPIVSAFVSVAVLQGNTVISSTLTDGSGHYLITGLQPGNYVIKASSSGYQLGVQGVSVVADQTVTANFSLAPNPGAISGTVTAATTLNPIAGASVQILQGTTLLSSGLTDSDGNFIFPSFAPGSYTITASAPNYQTFSLNAQVVSDQTTMTAIALQNNPGTISGTVIDSNSMQPVSGVVLDLLQGLTLVATTQTDANGQYILSQLPLGSYTLRATAPNYQVSSQGAIVSAGGTLIANVSLNILPSTLTGTVVNAINSQLIAGATINLLQGNILVANALSDANGNFNLSGLSSGSYSIQVSSPNYQTSLVGATLSINETINVLIALQPNPGSIQGTVTDSLSQPIVGASVVVDILQGNILVAQALTDVNGFYSIPDLAEGSYVIKASAANFQTATQGVIIRSGQVTVTNFTLSANPGSLTGIISDANTSLGVAGAQVTVLNGPVVVGSAITDSTGAYLISGLAPGSYTVLAAMNLYQSSVTSATVTSNATTTVNIALQSNPGTISGIITDNQGHVLAGAIVTVSGNSVASFSAVSSASGTYQISGLPPGNYIVTVVASGYQTFAIGVTVQAGEISTQNVSLAPNPGQIEGQIFDGTTHLPISNAVVQVLQNNVVITTVLTNEQGTFFIQNLAPGSYMIRISATGYQTILLSAFVVSGQTTMIDPDLATDPGALQGTITDSSAAPLANINVQVFQNLMLIAETFTDSTGFYLVTGLGAGNYTVVVGGQGFALQSASATIVSNQTTTLDFILDTLQGIISGRISEAVTGNPISGASVSLFSGTTLIAVTLTDVNGYYTLSAIPPGTYTLRVSAPNYQTLIDTTIVVSNGQTTNADEVLNPLPGSLAGQVTDLLTGEPLPNVVVTVLAGNVPIATTQTDASGNYLVTGLSPGVYTVLFSLSTYQTLQANVTIAVNATTVFNVALKSFPNGPSEVKQCQIKTKFLNRTEYANRVQWTASTSPSVVAYKIYRNGILVAQVRSSVLFYEDCKVSKRNQYLYQVAAVNALGLEGERVDATVAKAGRCVCR